MTKVLLIYPPYNLKEQYGALSEVGSMQQPLGIAYLGAYLEKYGFKTKIIDAPPLGWDSKKVIKETIDFNPDYIGFSVSTVDFAKTLKLATLIKKKLKTPIIIGGPHPTAMPAEVMKIKQFDYAVIGEGEITFVELIKALSEKRSLKKVSGLVFRYKNKIVRTKLREYISNLDLLPFPARHLMPPLKMYHPTPATYRRLPVASVMTSRGCPYNCSFCFKGVFGNRWRFRSPENVIKEVKLLVEKFKVGEIRFWDDTFNADPQRVKKICRLIIKKKLKFSWTCLCRVNLVDEKMLKLMKKAGCWQISYGIESGNEKILADMNKGINKKMIRDAVIKTYKAGIVTMGFFVIGLPGETKKTIRETIEFAKSLSLNAANFTIATPFPGTKLWMLAEKRGLLKGISYDKLLCNLPNKLFWVPEGLTARQLVGFEKQAYKEFYRNPALIYRNLKNIRSLGELVTKIKAFFTIQSI